jgi:AAA domain-containing protein
MEEVKKERHVSPAHTHTLKSLCEELLKGNGLSRPDKADFFFDSDQTKLIFNWYVQNQPKWNKNLAKEDADTITDQIKKAPLSFSSQPNSQKTESKKRFFHLKSIRAYQFAGIHKYKKTEDNPQDFYFEFACPFTMIEGRNGAGKTSLLNAIIWCLTGFTLRSQKPPEIVQTEIGVGRDLSSASATHRITGVTPIPPLETLKTLSDRDLDVNTFVELTFIDEDGIVEGPFRRAVVKNGRGTISITEPDFSKLGVDSIALEIGTRIPGLIPYIQLEEKSDLGSAVSHLTGIQPLQDLSKHAGKVLVKLQKEFPKEKKTEIESLSKEYESIYDQISEVLKLNLDLEIGKVPACTELQLEESLKRSKENLEKHQELALESVKNILGESFNTSDADQRLDLIANTSQAIALVDKIQIDRLASKIRFDNFTKIDETKIEEIEGKIDSLIGELREILELERNPDRAARIRLYSKVTEWLKEESADHNVDSCPICFTSLTGKLDPITHEDISKEFHKLLTTDRKYLGLALKLWEKKAIEDIKMLLPNELHKELLVDLSKGPLEYLRIALTEELFSQTPFKKSLGMIKNLAALIFSKSIGDIAQINFSDVSAIQEIQNQAPTFYNFVVSTYKIVDFARWINSHSELIGNRISAIVGFQNNIDDVVQKENGQTAGESSITSILKTLQNIVNSAKPINDLISKVDSLSSLAVKIKKHQNRITMYEEAAKALTPIVQLDALVADIVDDLLRKLSEGTRLWKDRLYVPASINAPKLDSTTVKGNGILEITASISGTSVGAQHVSNASDLRASLLGFLIAFWNYMYKERGGLSLLLLDDVHELFDESNTRRVANTIPQIVSEIGAHVIVTTNDSRFRRLLVTAAQSIGKDSVDMRNIHSITSVRDYIILGHFSEAIDQKIAGLEIPENEDNHQFAKEFASIFREFMEECLKDFFDMPVVGITSSSTLADFIGAISKRRTAGVDVFSSVSFLNFLNDPAMKQGSEFLKLLNQSHHGDANKVTFGEVVKLKNDFLRVKKILEICCEEYERWLRRDPRTAKSLVGPVPQLMAVPSFSAPIFSAVAAASKHGSERNSAENGDVFNVNWFENKSIYYLNTHNLGFAAPLGSRAIVSFSDEVVKSNRLVVATTQSKTYARRLYKSEKRPDLVVLGSEAENPRKRTESIFISPDQVSLKKIVGVVFDFKNVYHKSSDEAFVIAECNILNEVKVVFKIDGESGMPLALPGQKILAGSEISAKDIGAHEGHLVAVSTSDGDMFKRLGKVIPGFRNIRQLDSVGGHGESFLVRTEELEGDQSEIPVLHSMRRVIGVLYDIG